MKINSAENINLLVRILHVSPELWDRTLQIFIRITTKPETDGERMYLYLNKF